MAGRPGVRGGLGARGEDVERVGPDPGGDSELRLDDLTLAGVRPFAALVVDQLKTVRPRQPKEVHNVDNGRDLDAGTGCPWLEAEAEFSEHDLQMIPFGGRDIDIPAEPSDLLPNLLILELS